MLKDDPICGEWIKGELECTDLVSDCFRASSSMSSVIEAWVLGLSTGFLFSPVVVIGGVSAVDDNSDTGFGVD